MKPIKIQEMKRTILGVLLLACVNVQAQEKTLPQHEIAISYGYPTIAFMPSQNNDPHCDTFKDAWYGKEKEFGPLSIEYYHRSSRLLSVGGIFTLINQKKDITQNNQKIGHHSETYYSLMPAIKLSWLRGECVALYSKAALGVCVRPSTEKGVDTEDVKVDNTNFKVGPIYHLSLLGIEVGGRLRAFGELGFGVKGVYSAGLRYQF